MKYAVKKVLLMQVPQTAAHNAGSKYLQLTLQNPANRWATPERYTSFNELMVEEYSKYVGVAQPTGQKDQFGRDIYNSPLLNANNPIPAEDLEIPNLFAVIVPTPGGYPYVRVDDQRQPVKNSRGGYQLCTAIRVMCMKDTDNETGASGYMQGDEPDRKAMRILQQWYEPAWKFPEVAQPPMPGSTAAFQQAAQPQPAMQQPPTQAGYQQQPMGQQMQGAQPGMQMQGQGVQGGVQGGQFQPAPGNVPSF